MFVCVCACVRLHACSCPLVACNTDISYSGIVTTLFVIMTMQLLHVLHFQPKLSLITRTIQVAWADLTHFMVLFVLVEVRV